MASTQADQSSKVEPIPSTSTTPPREMSNDPTTRREYADGYMPIENYGLIGNMRTCAMVATDGSIDSLCWPYFDSPSIFARLLDKDKGGYWSITPKSAIPPTTKQQYLPSSNVLQTRFLSEVSVVNVVDFFPRPINPIAPEKAGMRRRGHARTTSRPTNDQVKQWLVRRVECIRGTSEVEMQILPAFNYARDAHEVTLITKHGVQVEDGAKTTHQVALFTSKDLTLRLEATIDCGDDGLDCPIVRFSKIPGAKLGDALISTFRLREGQAVSFVLREHSASSNQALSTILLDTLQHETQLFWYNWISKCNYKGRWREVISRSLLLLKMLTFELTGAIIAAPTFSLPEAIGGGRNWDYRFSWVRDSSFTIYILLRMGFHSEAEAYMNFMSDRFKRSRAADGSLPIMFSIHGATDLSEIELNHLDGYKGSKPVRIGNGAAFHKQFDIVSAR